MQNYCDQNWFRYNRNLMRVHHLWNLWFTDRSLMWSAVAWWLLPRTPDPEVGGSSPTRVKPCFVLEQGTFTPQKLLVIPRKWWLRPNMTEKLFTGTLRINKKKRSLSKIGGTELSAILNLSVFSPRGDGGLRRYRGN